MKRDRLTELLQAIRSTRVAVVGDFCLDAYWTIDPSGSELSLETGKPTHAVRRQRYGLGGAGNVVSNLVDLGVAAVYALGVVGDDLFGRELRTMLAAIRVNTDGLCAQVEGWDTPVYGKPYIGDDEQSRIDFGAFNAMAAQTEQTLLERLRAAAVHVQTVIVNQQLVRGIHSGAVIAGINCAIRDYPGPVFVVDSRHRSRQYEGAILKVNEAEAARLAAAPRAAGAVIPLEDVRQYAQRLFERTGRPVFVTRGARGLTAYDGREMTDVPGIRIRPPVDPVGAGDAVVSAMGAALATGATVAEAAVLANLAAAVTVQKLKECGTATPREIVGLWAESAQEELPGDRRVQRAGLGFRR